MSNTSSSGNGLFFIRTTVIAAMLLGIVASLSGAKAGQEKGGLKFAVVNPGRLIADYKYAKTSREALEKLDGEATVALQTWSKYPLLSTQDQDVLVALAVKQLPPGAQLTKAETDQQTALKTKHDNLGKEYNDLLGKPNAQTTPQDAARLEAFTKLRGDTDVRIKSKQSTTKEEITKKEEEFNAKIDKDIREQLTKVAKDKGMTMVFSSQVVLFADSDITDDVLKQLNK